MLELVRSISDTLRADESDALKSNAQRKSGCMAQEESLRRSVRHSQAALNELLMAQDHKATKNTALRRDMENSEDMVRHLLEERDGLQMAENEDADSFATATEARAMAATGFADHENRLRLYSRTVQDLLSVVERHFTGIGRDREGGAHDTVRVTALPSDAAATDAAADVPAPEVLLELGADNTTTASAAGNSTAPAVANKPVDTAVWRDVEAHAIYTSLHELLDSFTNVVNEERTLELSSKHRLTELKSKRNLERIRRHAANRTIQTDLKAANKVAAKAKHVLEAQLAVDA
eukprot:g1882.t1